MYNIKDRSKHCISNANQMIKKNQFFWVWKLQSYYLDLSVILSVSQTLQPRCTIVC